MPVISARGKIMPESPIRKLVPYADQAKKRGVKVFHLNIGQPDIHTPEEAFEAIRNFNEQVAEYSHSAGRAELRKGLKAYYADFGIKVSSNDMIITTGGSEAILFSLYACFNYDDEVIVPEPFYTNYNAFMSQSGVRMVPITSSIEDGFKLPPITEFEKVITPQTKGILICNPNNPTGYLYSREELELLKEIALKYDLYLISDEVYREFCYDGKEHFSVLQLEGMEQHAILIDSFSKRYSECGIRIGAVVSRNKKIISTILKFGQARLSPPLFGQIAAEASLKVSAHYSEKAYHEYLRRRNYIINSLNKIEGVYTPMPSGAFYSIVRLPVDDAEKFCQWILEEFEYKGATVMLAPAKGFYISEGYGQNEVRIAYVRKIEELQQAVKCIEKALEVYPGRTY